MSLNINLKQIVHQKCRICLNKGDIDIWNCKVSFKHLQLNENSFCVDGTMDVSMEKSFIELMDIFSNSQDLINLRDEFPLLCWQCLEDLKFCCIMYEKIKQANIQLQSLHQQSLNQCIEEEHLIEVVDEDEPNGLSDTNFIETLDEKNMSNIHQYKSDNGNKLTMLNKSGNSKQITPGVNDAFIVTQFIPETISAAEKYISHPTKDNEVLFHPTQHLLKTVNLKAVVVKDLDNLVSPQTLNDDITKSALYICQYCPRAFVKSDYLKTHVQKSHVCKFCTQPFIVTKELFKHIREEHSENKCAVCHKVLSSRTNLRHHIKRVHRIKLPTKVTLIDFIKSNPVEEQNSENEVEMLHEEIGAVGIHLNTQCQGLDLIEICSNDNNNAVIN